MSNGDVHLSLSGTGIIGRTHPLTDAADGTDLRIVTMSRCRFRVEVDDRTLTHIRVLDDNGNALELQRRQGQVRYSGDSWQIKRGRTPVLEVSEAGQTLVFLKDDEEVRRQALTLARDRVVVVEIK